MRQLLAIGIVVTLVAISHARPPVTAASSAQAGATPCPRVLLRVYPIDTEGLTNPIVLRASGMQRGALSEIGAEVEMEITIDTDGRVRDMLIRKSTGGARVEADALRSAFNTSFQPGTLGGRPVAVRMPWKLTVAGG